MPTSFKLLPRVGKLLSMVSGNRKSRREETLVLSTSEDVERAMATVTFPPKRVDIQASLLSYSKGPSLELLLKRVGCLEMCIQGKKCCPRRVFEHQVAAAISHVKAHKLKSLSLKNLDMRRIRDAPDDHPQELDFEHEGPLYKQLLTLENLEELHVVSCRLDSTLVNILQATERLPHLREVTIQLNDKIEDEAWRGVLVNTMTMLVQRPQVTSLAISEFPQDEEFWKGVESSQTLTHLGLAHRCDTPDQQQYWHLLRSNSSIQQLELQVDSGVSLSFLMDMLRKNTTVLSLFLHLQEDPTSISQQLTQVLESHNYILQRVALLCQNIYGYKVKVPCPRLDFFTKMNRQGRGHLYGVIRQADDLDWVEALAGNTYDLSSTFYWLRSNPNLFGRVC